jgi:ribulose-5-phosphate 4-epimerase/fuculose-1-phosphate aldolase
MKTIHSPEGVSLLMENLWLRHKSGMKQCPSNVYMVELPPPTEEELAEARRKAKEDSRHDDDPEELYGAWI